MNASEQMLRAILEAERAEWERDEAIAREWDRWQLERLMAEADAEWLATWGQQ